MSQYLQHDAAFACATAITELIAPLLGEKVQRQFFAQTLHACEAMIQSYEILRNREAGRLKPLPN